MADAENPERKDRHAPEKQGLPVKKTYVAPTVTDYGDIARLTQGLGATMNGDGGQQMMVI
jgi:hypothetical protein